MTRSEPPRYGRAVPRIAPDCADIEGLATATLASAISNAQVDAMSNCALCNTPITPANNSAEHLILNALGGFRTINGFICKPCNDVTGHSWDADLAAQLNGLCHFFDIVRDRGSVPPETISTTAGETFNMLSGGGFALVDPVVEKTESAGQTQYRIVARDMNEARKLLKDFKRRKAPNLDIEAELAKAQIQSSYLEGMVKLPVQIGGPAAGRTIVKSAVALVHASDLNAEACDQALAYLRNNDAPPCFGYYQAADVVIGRPAGVPLHCVAISGDPVSGMLLGYAEYFGFLRVVILLSESYCGPRVDRCHAIDPTTATELDLSVRLEFSHADMLEIFDYKHCDHEATKRAADAVFGPGMVRKRQREQKHAVNEAVQYAFDHCGAQPGERLTEEHVKTINRLMAEKLAAFILNQNRARPAPGFPV